MLAAAPQLLAVGAFCIGTNQIDLAAAAERGITVFNAPFSNTRSVVEMAIAELIALTRRLVEKNASMHQGIWDKSAAGAHEVRGRTLGIVGYGNIGTQLSVLAENLGMRVLFHDTADRLALGNAQRSNSLKDLLHDSDIVTLHVDGRPENRNIFGEAEFAAMRPGSLFLNLSRGFVVDYAALRRQIEQGHIAGAAVDVFPVEPKGRGDELSSELRGLPNVILTPHIGGSTEEAQQDIGQFVAHKFVDFVTEGSTALAVNVPALGLPRRSEHAAVGTPAPQRAGRAGPGERHPGRALGERRGPTARHPGRDRLPGDRQHQRHHPGHRGPDPGDAGDHPAAGHPLDPTPPGRLVRPLPCPTRRAVRRLWPRDAASPCHRAERSNVPQFQVSLAGSYWPVISLSYSRVTRRAAAMGHYRRTCVTSSSTCSRCSAPATCWAPARSPNWTRTPCAASWPRSGRWPMSSTTTPSPAPGFSTPGADDCT